MKDKELKIEEIEGSHTRWRWGRSRCVQGKGLFFHLYEVYYKKENEI
jgi:hypothetical protein